MINYSEIIKTVDLQPIQMVSGDSLKFRIEIIRDNLSGEFSAILWRVENYRIQPTFPQQEGVPNSDFADEEILVRDSYTLENIKAQNADSALQLALKTMEEKFT
jgi:hypothetical protein